MPKVSSRDHRQNVSHFHDLAFTKSVEGTKGGRNYVVTLSALEYRRLTHLDRQALFASEVPAEVVARIEGAEG